MFRNSIFAMFLSTVTGRLLTEPRVKPVNQTNATVTQKEVDAERAKLEHMVTSLGGMLKDETLSHNKVGPAIHLFTENLNSVLASSKSMQPAEAMQQLAAAKSGIAGLVGEMTKQQESLMRDDFEQREGLLLGVLMTHQKDSIAEQLKILSNEDFATLDVSKELLRKHDDKTALYVQAAQYLDAHKHAGGNMTVVSKEKAASRVSAMAASLDKRTAALEHSLEVREVSHKKRIQELTEQDKKGDKHAMHFLKHEEREFKKWAAMTKHDIASMKAAAAAVRSGDMEALQRAQAAIQKSLESLKSKNGGMLVFLQQGNTYLERDCPFCVAQCVEKCHNKGEPYVSCLTKCADAGS